MATILIVEDEPIIAADVKILCEKAGHIVPEVIDSGEEVIQKVSSIKPDLVLLDIALAGTLSGLQVAEFLQKIKLQFIFITSFMDETTLSNVQRLQPAAYIVKPFQENNLLANIDLALFKERVKTGFVCRSL
jgi:DNA-binding response OmpR family regulator